MTKEQEARHILRYFAEKFDLTLGDMFIAGGWAACPFRANDIDIWYFRPDVELFNEDYRRLGNLLYVGENWVGETFGTSDNLTELKELKWYGKPVQIFETPYNLIELLNHFDLSCHRYAITNNGTVITGPGATDPFEEEIVILTPEHTILHRLQKLQKRYGHEVTDNG